MANNVLTLPHLQRPQSATLLSLPNEILDQIFLYSLIPDQIWVHVLRSSSDSDAILPVVRLDYFVTEAGSQFCVQPFSLRRLVICRPLHAQLMVLFWRTVAFNLGRTHDAELLFDRACKQSCVHHMNHISIALEDGGSLSDPLASYEQITAPIRGRRWPSLKVVEIRTNIDAFDRSQVNTQNPWRWTRNADTMVLLQCCLLGLAVQCGPDMLESLDPKAQYDALETVSSVEVRIPCFERDKGRLGLLQGELLNKHCNVEWVKTKHDRYGGQAGYISIRQRLGKERTCCPLLLRNIILAACDDERRRLDLPMSGE